MDMRIAQARRLGGAGRRALHWVVAAALTLTVLAAVELTSTPAARAADVPWTCTPTAYLFQAPTGTPTNVYSVNLVTGANTQVGTIAGNYVNAVGFNVIDHYMYGWNQTGDQLVRINADFTLTNLGVPRNSSTVMDRTGDWTTGEVTDAGIMWLLQGGTGKWAQVNLTTSPPALIATGTAAGPANTTLPADWAMVGGTLYGVVKGSNANNNTTAYLLSFNPSTKQFTNLGVLTGVTGGGPSFGAVYSDGTYIYAGNNQSGIIYRINPSTRAVINLAQGPISQMNDGSMCHTPVPTVTLVKNVGGRLVPDDQFEVSLVDPSGATVASATTSGTATTASTSDTPVVSGATYTIIDRLTPGSTSSIGDYTGTLACLVSGTGIGTASPGIAAWTLTIQGSNQYVCTVTNTPVPRSPGLSLVKSVSPQGAGALTVGNELTYRYVATNTGNVTLTDVRTTETQFSGTGTPPDLATCTIASLAPGDSLTCSATYTVTQEDVDAGSLTNTAIAHGTDPDGDDVPSNESSTSLTEAPDPALTLTKTAFPLLVQQAGTTVTYTFLVENTGTVTVNTVAIDEETFTGSGSLSAATCAATTLIPGGRTTCTATYVVTQADLDAATTITNTATATGRDPTGELVTSPEDDADIVPLQNPLLSVSKSADPTTVDTAGDTVTYTFDVSNDGNTTISGLTIAEDAFSGTGAPPTLTCAATTLAPGATTSCTGVYTVTQADIDAGTITNSGHASGTTPGGDPVDSTPDDAVVGVVPVQALDLVKSADPTTVSAPGDTVVYTYEVTNNGSQTVTNLAIAELFGGAGTAPTATCLVTTLTVGASTTCTATYTVTQTDIDAGTITNTAHATGTDPAGNEVVSNDDDADVTAVRTPAMTIVKTADTRLVTAVGQTVTYSYLVTNTGNVTLTAVGVVETSFSGAGRAPLPTCPPAAASLAPRASVTCTATYVVVAADLDGGTLRNVAYATGTQPNGGGSTRSDPDEADVPTIAADRATPRIGTTTSAKRVRPGERFFDRVRVSGLAGTSRVTAVARLYGPFPSRATATCQPATLARAVTWRVRNGTSSSPKVRVSAPGVYTWQVTTSANPANLSATHACGLTSETTTVAKPVYIAPLVNGGFSGTILQRPSQRIAPVTVSLPAIGLHAPVVTASTRKGRMNLPDDVAEIGWLRRSAGAADAIGTTVIGGHVSDRHDRPGAMYRLSRAKRGQLITVTVQGRKQRFKVTGTATYVRGRRLPQRYFATTGRHRLVLISCTDRIITAGGHFHYARYQVVVATQVRSR
jgi:uncharacterized repeat protein (TIGR01451 family)